MDSETLTFEPLPGTTSDKHIYRLKGPLVLGNMFPLQEVLRSSNVTTILDMTEVPYADSAGLGVLTNSYVAHQKRGHRFLLVGVNERIGQLFKMTRLDRLFEVYPTVDSANDSVTTSTRTQVA